MIDLAVLIGTCDAYSPLWPNFLTCFEKYWKVDTQEIIFAGETKQVDNYPTHMPGLNLTWATRILETLEKIESNNIFFILDDYFLSEEMPSERMHKYLADFAKYDMNRLQISARTGGQTYHKSNIPYVEIANERYVIACQPSIWKKQWIIETLDPSYSPWDFEMIGSHKLANKETCTYIAEVEKHIYFNAVRRGFKKSEGWEGFREREGLPDF